MQHNDRSIHQTRHQLRNAIPPRPVFPQLSNDCIHSRPASQKVVAARHGCQPLSRIFFITMINVAHDRLYGLFAAENFRRAHCMQHCVTGVELLSSFELEFRRRDVDVEAAIESAQHQMQHAPRETTHCRPRTGPWHRLVRIRRSASCPVARVEPLGGGCWMDGTPYGDRKVDRAVQCAMLGTRGAAGDERLHIFDARGVELDRGKRSRRRESA